MNKTTKEILEKLTSAGFEAYIVGGYVRDYLLGEKSKDIDICTSATMKEVIKLIPGNVNEYHSLNFKKKELNIDITTFRKEKKYKNRKPVKIEYTSSLADDLKRRDFTINAICMDKDGKIIDELNGQKDLKQRIIRMIGNVSVKVSEDPLRILRAVRFATVLDFTLDEKLEVEIRRQRKLLKSLSSYRIKEEVSKILVSSHYKKGLALLKNLGLCEYLGISFTRLVYTNDLCGMWAQIKMDRDLPFTKNEKENIVSIQEILSLKMVNAEVIYTYGLYLSTVAGEILGISKKAIYAIYKHMAIYSRKDLAIDFNEIVEILGEKPSKKIREIEEMLIKEVLYHRLENRREILKSYLLANKQR